MVKKRKLFEKALFLEALRDAFILLKPGAQAKNPVLFVVEVGALLILLYIFQIVIFGGENLRYFMTLDIVLYLTLLFANFATALAEARGRAQVNYLRATRRDTIAYRLNAEPVLSTLLNRGDKVVVQAGQVIPADGEIIEGIAYVDESAITGESAPMLREAGGDRSGVTAGTTVLTDQIIVQVTSKKGESFLDKMIALIEGTIRQKSPNELALTMLLSAFTLIFLIVVISLWPMAYHAENYMHTYNSLGTDVPTLIALLICLIPTTIGALLSAIGIAGMDRALQANVISKSGKSVEEAGDVDVVLLDKTGTITMGNRSATKFYPIGNYSVDDLAKLASLTSIADNTPEGKSIRKFHGLDFEAPAGSIFIPFSAKTRMSGIDLASGHSLRKGAPDAILNHVGGTLSEEIEKIIHEIGSKGASPLLISDGTEIAGAVELQDELKPHMLARLTRLRQMGLRVIMVTGDHSKTAAAICALAGIDEFLAEATPGEKLEFIRKTQKEGNLVAMMGDGTNDAPALAQADVAIAMNAGTEAAKEAANMIDLDSDPSKIIEVIEIGKQLLITRGALTTFSLTNDVAKYFAIVPALFASTLPWLKPIDIMHLTSPTSAILSAIIFNALIIPCLIPLALKGVSYRPLGADALFRRNLSVWGLGGLITPFIGIKLIDMTLSRLGI